MAASTAGQARLRVDRYGEELGAVLKEGLGALDLEGYEPALGIVTHLFSEILFRVSEAMISSIGR